MSACRHNITVRVTGTRGLWRCQQCGRFLEENVTEVSDPLREATEVLRAAGLVDDSPGEAAGGVSEAREGLARYRRPRKAPKTTERPRGAFRRIP